MKRFCPVIAWISPLKGLIPIRKSDSQNTNFF
jgi:hypothetical protein